MPGDRDACENLVDSPGRGFCLALTFLLLYLLARWSLALLSGY